MVPLIVVGTLLPRSVPGQTAATVLVADAVLVAVGVAVGGAGVGVLVGAMAAMCRLNVPLDVEKPSTMITML